MVFSEIHLKKPFPNLSTVNCQPNSVDKSWTIGCQLSTVHGDTLKSVSPVDSWLTDDADTFAPVVNCQDHVHHHFFARQHRQHRLCERLFFPTRKYWQNQWLNFLAGAGSREHRRVARADAHWTAGRGRGAGLSCRPAAMPYRGASGAAMSRQSRCGHRWRFQGGLGRQSCDNLVTTRHARRSHALLHGFSPTFVRVVYPLAPSRRTRRAGVRHGQAMRGHARRGMGDERPAARRGAVAHVGTPAHADGIKRR